MRRPFGQFHNQKRNLRRFIRKLKVEQTVQRILYSKFHSEYKHLKAMLQSNCLFQDEDQSLSQRFQQPNTYSFRLHNIIIIAQLLRTPNCFILEARLYRLNFQQFTIHPSQQTIACSMLNRNSQKNHLGNFTVDFFNNSIRYVYKLFANDSMKDTDQVQQMLGEAKRELKERIYRNLGAMLVVLGEPAESIRQGTQEKIVGKLGQQLEMEVITILEEKEHKSQTIQEEKQNQNILHAYRNVKDIQFDEDETIDESKSASGYIRQGGYFRIEGKIAKLTTQDNIQNQVKIIVKKQKRPQLEESSIRLKNQIQIVKSILAAAYLPIYLFPASKSDDNSIYMLWTTSNTLLDFTNTECRCSIRKKLRLMYEVTCAVQSLHQSNILHRDLKPSNILVQNDLRVKIIDFSESLNLKQKDLFKFNRGSTKPYAAPQLYYPDSPPRLESDVWSLGIILYEIFEGRQPIRHLKSMTEEIRRSLSRISPVMYDKQKGGIWIVHRIVRQITHQTLIIDYRKRLPLSKIKTILQKLLRYTELLEQVN